MQYCWKTAAEWNIKVEVTLEERIKIEKKEDENFQVFI